MANKIGTVSVHVQPLSEQNDNFMASKVGLNTF